MKYVRLRVWIIFALVVAGVIFLLQYSSGGPGTYISTSPISDSLLTASYPDLYNAVTSRDAQELKPFLSHEHEEVRAQAWRALANTPVDSISEFIELAKEQNSEVAWFGISNHELTTDQLRSLEGSWTENPELRAGIVRVLGRQGDGQTLNFLLDKLDGEIQNQYQFALAVGRLVQQFDIGQSEQIGIIQNAFDADDYETTRAYFYGWYRGDKSGLTDVARDTLFDRWQLQGVGLSRIVDQYINKILPEKTTATMAIYYNGEQELDNHTQLAYELATSVEKIPLTDRNSLAAKFLLTNANPHVQVRTLQSLTGKMEEGDDLHKYVTNDMITDEMLADVTWLQALRTALEVDPAIATDHRDRLQAIPQENPYLWPEALNIYQQLESADEYLERVQQMIDRDTLSTMAAVQSLDEFWQQLPSDEKTEDRIDHIRNIVFDALEIGDRGVAFTTQSALLNEDFFGTNDFERINQSLSSFSLPGDIEVYQAYGSLYKERFEQQAKPVIDSLAELEHEPLNRSLAAAGWDVPVPKDDPHNEFLSLDWERIWELGREPVLTLRTQKGFIEMQLNTLTAPATVAMIDSLNRAGMYENVPFHRVVPNFVVQGGDFERRDGFGGPDFTIPTEASEQEFGRGATGIASAGADTEGSQYFIMHQWKPHLNGSYTRFGRVISGMDVVDDIVEGDSVLTTTWH